MLAVPAVALVLAFAPPPANVDHTTACSRWALDRDAGFEGGETAAVLDCTLPEGNWRPFHVGCAGGRITLRVQPQRAEVLDGRIAEATAVFAFVPEAGEVPVVLRYEAAVPDFAAYLPPTAAAELVTALRSELSVTLRIGSATETYPLAGSAAALAPIMSACGLG